MPVPRSHPPPGNERSLEHAFDWAFLAVAGHAACAWPFLRRDFGSHAFTFAGPLAMAVMFLAASLLQCPEAMTYFFAVWLALVVAHRGVTRVKRARGWMCHSRYDGDPWLVRALFRPVPGEFVAKAGCEPLLCLVAGGVVSLASVPLGLFVASLAVSLAVKKGIEQGIEDRHLREWRDKELEMRHLFGRYRNGS